MIGNKTLTFTTLDSTNKYIKEHIYELEPGTVVVTDYQTNGYGRLSRTWFDNPSLNLTFSFLLKQKIKLQTSMISQVIGAALITALKQLDIKATIKWPNDILIGNKKVAGILVESKILNDDIYLIIGIGLNVNSTEFDSSISTKATSLKLETNNMYKLDDVLDTIIIQLNHFTDRFNKSDYSFLDICRENNALLHKIIVLNDTKETGKVIGIDDDGSLIVLVNNKEKKYFGSEITLSNTYNSLGE